MERHRPEVCRTFHQESRGGTSNNQYSSFLQRIELYDGPDVFKAKTATDWQNELSQQVFDAALRARRASSQKHSLKRSRKKRVEK